MFGKYENKRKKWIQKSHTATATAALFVFFSFGFGLVCASACASAIYNVIVYIYNLFATYFTLFFTFYRARALSQCTIVQCNETNDKLKPNECMKTIFSPSISFHVAITVSVLFIFLYSFDVVLHSKGFLHCGLWIQTQNCFRAVILHSAIVHFVIFFTTVYYRTFIFRLLLLIFIFEMFSVTIKMENRRSQCG